jgi:hypothetical protein
LPKSPKLPKNAKIEKRQTVAAWKKRKDAEFFTDFLLIAVSSAFTSSLFSILAFFGNFGDFGNCLSVFISGNDCLGFAEC